MERSAARTNAPQARRGRLGAHAGSFPRRRRLDRSEEIDLVRRAAAGDERALERLFEAHFPLVAQAALAWRGRGVSVEDLVGEACIGLVEAVERFDPAHGARFMTYATWWMRRRLVQALARQGRVVPIPRQRLAAGRPRPPREQSLSEPAGENGRPWAELLASGVAAPDESAARGEERARLRGALAGLAPRQRLVLERRFGLDTQGDGCTLRDIAAELGVSKERVRQIEGEGLARLRGSLLAPVAAVPALADRR